MQTREIHECQCAACQAGDAKPEKQLHQQINLVLSRLDEQQRRWYAAVEANRHGHGGIKLVSQITGLDEKTIHRGQEELSLELENRPFDRIRLCGGGRPSAKKKIQK
jgi:hypothetical protein